MKKTKILFDGNCIVCDFEISHYKRLAPDVFELVDISSPEFNADAFRLTKAAVDKHMHVVTPEGELKIGVDAFAHIWDRLDRYRFFGKAVRLPVVNAIAKGGYAVFARYRHLLPKKKR